MYTSAILASAALMATTALAGTPGSAIVVNACTYPVYLSAVPAADGGQSEVDITLQPKASWSQQYTELTNGNGWSIKLSKTQELNNILQYEYTYHNDGTIWYDLSCVNGNPWDANWEITASGSSTCIPKQSYYRYATDDAYGMQSCADDSTITVTLCSGESQADSAVSAVLASTTPQAVAATTVAPITTTQQHTSTSSPVVATTTSSPVAATTSGSAMAWNGQHFYNADAEVVKDTSASVTATTFATSVVSAVQMVDTDGHVVTEVVTVVETATAYETYVPAKRHVHHQNHPHAR